MTDGILPALCSCLGLERGYSEGDFKFQNVSGGGWNCHPLWHQRSHKPFRRERTQGAHHSRHTSKFIKHRLVFTACFLSSMTTGEKQNPTHLKTNDNYDGSSPTVRLIRSFYHEGFMSGSGYCCVLPQGKTGDVGFPPRSLPSPS